MWQYNDGTTELYHYGILGMKWGVRRYQNPDGTLTKKGKERYADGASKETFEKDLKTLNSRKGLHIDYEIEDNGRMSITKVHSSDGKIRGQEYAQQLLDENDRRMARRRASALAGTAAVIIGAEFVNRMWH